jgi:Domain of unknown function (DUF4395)
MATSPDRGLTGSERPSGLPTYDVTARKAHQWTMLAFVAIGFVLGGPVGAIPLAVAGAIMLIGRFWWPADVVRQAVWRGLEPWGILQRRELHEDHETRRVARVLGGLVWLGAAVLVVAGLATVAWILAGLIAAMVLLDAAVDFCALCFVVSQLERRGLFPARTGHGA